MPCDIFWIRTTVEEWSAISVNQYDETCSGESTDSTSGPFELSGQACESITITFNPDGSFNAECETSVIPVPVPGSWIVYNNDMICLTVGNDEDCATYSYSTTDGSFGLSGLGDDGNCYETVFQLTSTLAIDEFGIPTDFSVYQNYPNPFNPSTNIPFALPFESDVKVNIYDVRGRLVQELVNSHFGSGYHHISWDASHLSSGLYFIQFESSSSENSKTFSTIQKSLLVK